jgi:hypothetical protein
LAGLMAGQGNGSMTPKPPENIEGEEDELPK